MKISEEEAVARLGSSANLAQLNVEHKQIAHRGTTSRRGNGLPEFLRDTIGTLAVQPDVQSSAVAAAFEVSNAEVSFCKSGKIGGHPATSERKAKVDDRLERIKDVALLKLMASLELIDDDRLQKCNAKELSTVAVNMGKVVKDVTPQEATGPQVNVVIYSPETKPESKYKVVDV